MSSCDELECDGTCRGEHGTFDNGTSTDVISDTTACGNTYSTDYEYAHTVNPTEEPGVAYNEIDDYKNFWMNGYFEDAPYALLPTDICNYDFVHVPEAYPLRVEFVLEHPDNYYEYDYKFRDPHPSDGDDGTEFTHE